MTEPTRKLCEILLDSGELVYVQPLNPYFRQAISDQARDLYPDPDPKAYEKPMANALIDGMMLPGHENPDYITAYQQAQIKQRNHTHLAVMLAAVVDTPEGWEQTLRRYARRLAYNRQAARLPDDDWQALVLSVLVVTLDDINAILAAAMDTIKEDEVRRGLRTLRFPVRQFATGSGDGRAAAPDLSS